MPFVIFVPIGKKGRVPTLLNTSNTFVDQVWQELVMLRYLKLKHLTSLKLIGPWIDQAQSYYLDSIHSNWRSSGLLYYYSFLNLSKALLVGKRKLSFKVLDTTAIHHGLQANLQDVRNIADYKIKIYPPTSNGRKNVFSNFFGVVTSSKWPFSKVIEIKLLDVLGYCQDISQESEQLFNIPSRVVVTRSLHRELNNHMWFEFIVQNSQVHLIKSQFSKWNLQYRPYDDLEPSDKTEWHDAFKITVQILKKFTLIRTHPISYNNQNRAEIFKSLMHEVTSNLQRHVSIPVFFENNDQRWDLIPDINLFGKPIPWRPILSNYLMSFALSTILRYQPQLLKNGSGDNFYAQAWCSQCSRSTLGSFLMLFTDPPIIVRSI